MFIRNAWYIAAWTDEVKQQPLARRICNEPVVLFRDRSGRPAALVDRCCHRSAPLSLGEVVPDGIQCGYHGLTFDNSGRCVAVPGQSHIADSVRVQSYPVVEKNQFVWIWMGDAARADTSRIVDFPYHDDHAHWPNKHDCYPIKANYMLMVDNLMDLTHLGYLHAKTVGGNPMAHVNAEMKTTHSATGLKFTRWMKNSVPPPSYVKAAGFQGRVDRWQEFEWVAPSSVLQWTGAADAGIRAAGRSGSTPSRRAGSTRSPVWLLPRRPGARSSDSAGSGSSAGRRPAFSGSTPTGVTARRRRCASGRASSYLPA